jgi:hypothetical protein
MRNPDLRDRLDSQLVKYVASKNRKEFMNDLKLFYLSTMQIMKKWTKPLANWGTTIQQLAIHFCEDRIKLEI